MLEVVQSREHLESLCTGWVLASTKEECLGVVIAVLLMVEHELPIMKKKREMAGDCPMGGPGYVDPHEEEEEVL